MAKNKVELILTGDAKGATRAFGEVDKSAHSLSGKLSTLGTHMGKLGLLMGGALAGGLVAAGAGFIGALNPAMKLQSAMEKTNIVFGDSVGIVKTWAQANAVAMGLNSVAVAGLAANMGDLLIPMGFTRDTAADMSTKMTGLAGALSSWTGGTRSAADVAVVLQKSLLGNRDGLSELGIKIMDADVKQRLLANGTSELTGKLLEQAVAQASMELIFEKSTDAQNAFSDSTVTAYEKQLQLRGMFEEVKEKLLRALLPAYDAILSWSLKNWPAIQEVIDTAFRVAGETISWVKDDVIPLLMNAFVGIYDWVVTNLPAIQSTFETVFAAIGAAIDWISDEVVPRVQAVIQFFREWFEGDGGPAIGGVFDFIKGAAEGVRAFIVDVAVPIIQSVLQNFRNWWDEHGAAVVTVFGAIRDAAAWVIDKVRDHWPEISAAILIVWGAAQQPLRAFVAVLGEILDAAAWVIDKMRTDWPEISGKVTSVWNAIAGPLSSIASAFNAIASAIGWALDKLNLYNSTPVMHKAATFSSTTTSHSIPTFAEGGMVPGSGPVPAIVHGGERVLSKADNEEMLGLLRQIANGRGNSGGNTFNVRGETGLQLGRQVAAVLAGV